MPRPVLLLPVVAVFAVCACAGPPGAGAAPSRDPDLPPGIVTLQPMPDDPPPLDFSDELDPSEQLALPIPSADVSDFIQRVQTLAGDSPDSGGPALSDDRTTVTLYWFGTPPQAIQDLVEEYEGRVVVDVVPTRFRPGDLMTEAERLIDEHAPTVQAVAPRPQGDGVDVLVEEAAVERAGSLDIVLAELDSPFPLFGEVGGIMAI